MIFIAAAPSKPSLKAEYGPAQINAVGRALRTIYACPAGQQPDVGLSTSLQSLYLAVEGTVVLAAQGQDLYERVKMELERAVGEVARSLSAGASDGDEPSWLRRLDEAWVSWCDKTVSSHSTSLLTLSVAYGYCHSRSYAAF